jgi:MbtH protein
LVIEEAATGSSPPRYQVVVNHEEQYSIWPADDPAPAGWQAAGFAGTRDECLAHVDATWTDITPLSVRATGRAAGQ